MPSKKKKFITNKESTRYKLISGYVDDDDEPANESPEEKAARKEEERKYGVFFNDDYNYMKHLRSLNESAVMVNTQPHIDPEDDARSVTSQTKFFFEMFSTDVQEGESIDPEILAALDGAPAVALTEEEMDKGDEAGSSFLEDDFISMAGGVVPKPEPASDEEEWSDEEYEEAASEEMDSDFGISDDEDDIGDDRDRRGTVQDDIIEAQTALILRNFEEGLGFHSSNMVPDLESEVPTEEEYERFKMLVRRDKGNEDPVSWSEVFDDKEERVKIDPSRYIYEDEDEIVWTDAPKSKPKFDCVSILSLNSNTRNLPTDLIPPSSKPKKTRAGGTGNESNSGVASDRGLSLRQLEQEMRESRQAERADRASTFRPQGETADEKKARKKAIRDERKERRQEKKANKQVFSIERENMHKEAAALAKSVKSVKIT